MTVEDILLGGLVPLLLYSGPILPFAIALMLRGRPPEAYRKDRRRLLILGCVQAVLFVPLVVAVLLHVPHAIHALTWPAIGGTILFVWGFLHLLSELARLRS